MRRRSPSSASTVARRVGRVGPVRGTASVVAPSYVVPALPRSRRVPLRAALLIDAPDRTVREAIRAVGTWARATTAAGLTVEIAGRPANGGVLQPGDVLRVGKPGRQALYRVATAPPGGAEVVRLDGIGAAGGRHLTITSAPTLAGTLVTAEVHGGPALGRVRTLRALQMLLGIITLVPTGSARNARPVDPEPAMGAAGVPDGRRVVVAGVLVQDGTILAARRTHPPELAGLWECPGGKVEPDEAETDALVRELAEELGIEVRVGRRIGPECDIGHGYVLHAYLVELISGTPSPRVHDAIRWVGTDEVGDLQWLPSDSPLIPHLRALLDIATSPAGPVG